MNRLIFIEGVERMSDAGTIVLQDQTGQPVSKKKVRLLAGLFFGYVILLFVGFALAYYVFTTKSLDMGTSLTANGGKTEFVKPAQASSIDDMNYVSEDLEIHIEKVVREELVMYVADVKMKDARMIRTAFAKDRVGRNILETTSDIAERNHALFAVNGDYYGFRDTGLVVRNGLMFRNRQKQEMMVLYENGVMETFEKGEAEIDRLKANKIMHAFSFGPILVKNGEPRESFDKQYKRIRGRNPRTGMGMIEPNHFVFLVVDGRSDESRGLSLAQFAQEFAALGCKEAYNLDGGSSSSLYFNSETINKAIRNETYEREISDIIYIPLPEAP